MDLRSTIYWNPTVKTDKDGKAAFNFFTAGTPGIYKVVIEGIDNKGSFGRSAFVLHIQ